MYWLKTYLPSVGQIAIGPCLGVQEGEGTESFPPCPHGAERSMFKPLKADATGMLSLHVWEIIVPPCPQLSVE